MSIRKTRSDARENRGMLVRSAAEVFATHGFDVPLEVVAAKAGVSRTTLYRNFPDRDALGFAIFEQSIVELNETAQALSGTPDGFLLILEILQKRLVESAGLTEVLCQNTSQLGKIAVLRSQTIELMMPLLHQAQYQGLILPHIDANDLDVLLEMLGASIRGPEENRPLRAERAMNILRRGLLSTKI